MPVCNMDVNPAGDVVRPSPRSQAERSAGTQRRLLEATLVCVAEIGLAQASTPMICARAKVSRGALTHHYRSRNDLVRAAIEHATRAAMDGIDREMARPAARRDPISAFCAAIWRTIEGPLFPVALEFLVAGRTDAEIGRAVAEGRLILHAHVERQLAEVARLAGRAGDASVHDLLLASVYLVRGLALQKLAGDDMSALRRVFREWETALRTRLDHDGGPRS